MKNENELCADDNLNIRLLSIFVLRKWKKILLCSVLLGVVMAGAQVIKQKSGSSAAEYTEVQEKYTEAKEKYEQQYDVYTHQIEESLKVINDDYATIDDRSSAQNIYSNANAALKNLKKPANTVEAAKSGARKAIVKYCAFGLAGGFFCAVIYYVLCFACGGVLRTDDEIGDKYGYQKIAGFKSLKKEAGKFDRRMASKASGMTIEDEELYKVVAILLAQIVKNNEAAFVSTCSDSVLNSLAEEIEKAGGVKYATIPDVLNHADALKNLTRYHKVVIVEKKDTTKNQSLDHLVRYLNELNIDVAGYITL